MSTSGSLNFSQTKNEIILDAFQILGVYGIGRTVSSEDLTFASSMLNKMVKAWAAKGLHLWCKTDGVLYLTQYENEYNIGSSATAYATLKSDEIITKLNGTTAASTTSLTVDNTTGMQVNDYIGVVLTSGAIHWSTIATIPNSTTLTINAGLSSEASDNALIFTFTNKLYKPLRILSTRNVQGIDEGNTSSIVESIITLLPNNTYVELPDKTTNSNIITQAYYKPELTTGKLYVWPRPTDCSNRIEFTFERLIEDLDNTSDDFDFPSEWLECLTYQLAVRLARPFGKPSAIQDLLPLASQMLEDLLSWDTEINEVYLMPDLYRQ